MKRLAVIIGIHSCVVGLPLLIAPRAVLRATGFAEPVDTFFPSMVGVFLIIMGICYLRAVREPAFVSVILASKASAVVFLSVNAVWLAAPPVIWVMLVGDALMLAGASTLAARRPAPAARTAGP